MARILVVDDNPAIRSLVREALESEGHAITEASNGTEALASLASERVELVITDIFMPEMDGIELARRIATYRQGTVPILAISGGGSLPGDFSCLLEAMTHLGATRTLMKPFRRAELLRIVNEMLQAGSS